MSEEKKELKKNLKNEELCEGKQKLSIDELAMVNGGGVIVTCEDEGIAKPDTIEAASALQGKAWGVVVTTSEGRQGSEMRFGIR